MSKFNPFREAKEFIKDELSDIRPKTAYICWALDYVRERHSSNSLIRAITYAAQKHIRDMLGKYPCVETWLHEHHHCRYQNQQFEQIQIYRKQWLDHLANEYDAGRLILHHV